MVRKRKNPQDKSKFHSICDICHNSFVEKQLLLPFIASTEKLGKLIEVREADLMGLNMVREEVESHLNLKKRKVDEDH